MRKRALNYLITVAVMFATQIIVKILLTKQFNLIDMVTDYTFLVFWGVFFGLSALITFVRSFIFKQNNQCD